jgi:hypothetical protein
MSLYIFHYTGLSGEPGTQNSVVNHNYPYGL